MSFSGVYAGKRRERRCRTFFAFSARVVSPITSTGNYTNTRHTSIDFSRRLVFFPPIQSYTRVPPIVFPIVCTRFVADRLGRRSVRFSGHLSRTINAHVRFDKSSPECERVSSLETLVVGPDAVTCVTCRTRIQSKTRPETETATRRFPPPRPTILFFTYTSCPFPHISYASPCGCRRRRRLYRTSLNDLFRRRLCIYFCWKYRSEPVRTNA